MSFHSPIRRSDSRSISTSCLPRRVLDLRASTGSATTCATTSTSKAKATAHIEVVRRLIRMVGRMCRLYSIGESMIRRVCEWCTTGM